MGRAFVRHLERAQLTRGRNEREQHFPQYRHAVHQIVQGGRRRWFPAALVVLVAAAHRQCLRELFLPGTGACQHYTTRLLLITLSILPA